MDMPEPHTTAECKTSLLAERGDEKPNTRKKRSETKEKSLTQELFGRWLKMFQKTSPTKKRDFPKRKILEKPLELLETTSTP